MVDLVSSVLYEAEDAFEPQQRRVRRTRVIVLDTHAFHWWVSAPARLSKPAARAIERADRIILPAIVLWELLLLEDQGRLRFDRPANSLAARGSPAPAR